MLNAFGHLAVRAWGAMIAASSTSTFGLLCWLFGGAIAVWIAQVSYRWFSSPAQDGRRPGLGAGIEKTWKPFLLELCGLFSLVVIVWGAFVYRTVYYERTGMRWAYTREIQRNRELQQQLDHRKNEMDVSDPSFGDTAHLLLAFSGFRNAVHGESCVVHITAPKESMDFASMVAQFSVATSNCPTFGPDGVGFDRNPDLAHVTLDGMEAGVVTFHAARDDKAANALFFQLSNLLPLKRSYDPLSNPERIYQVPPGGYAHTVWLQFGPHVGWVGQSPN